MKVIIAGSRLIDRERAMFEIDTLVIEAARAGISVTEILSGHCEGVDRAGERWASIAGVRCQLFLARWRDHGRKAGPLRNQAMADLADALILVWDGKSRGSADVKRRALAKGIPVFERIVMP